MSVRLGATLAGNGLKLRSWWLLSALFAGAVLVAGLLERAREPAYAADRTLLGATFGVAVPLFCYALFGAVYRQTTTQVLFEPLARHGANRRELSLGMFGALAACAGAGAAILGMLTVLATRGTGDPRLPADLLATAWSGASIAISYTGLLALGSLWGRNGRIVVLIADWLFGSGTGVFALPWPRGHARNLLGGEPVLGLAQGSALLLLWLVAAVGVLIFTRRVPP